MKEIDNKNIKKKFRKRQNMRFISTAIAAIITPFIYITRSRYIPKGSSGPLIELPAYISVTVAIIAALMLTISLLTWRCPVCNKFLGRSTIITKCNKCGTKFI